MDEFRHRFLEVRKRAGVSQENIARFCGVSRNAVSKWEQGNAQPTLRNVQKAVMILNTTVGWLVGEHTEFYRHHLRRKTASQKVPLIDHEMATHWYDRERPRTRPIVMVTPSQKVGQGSFALMIKDTSMEPGLFKGDLVIVDPKEKPNPGEYIAAHCLTEDEVIIRKYRPRKSLPTEQPIIGLMALNEDWPEIELSVLNPGRLIGTVVELRRYRPNLDAVGKAERRSRARNVQHAW